MPVVKGDVKTVYESARKFASRRFAKETKRMQDALDEAEDKARKADEMNVAFRRYAAHLEGDAGAVVATLKRLEKEEASQKRLREELEAELEEARRDRARVAAKEARMKKEWADTCAAWKKRQEADKRDAEAERKRMEESERAALAAAESERRRREEAERAVAAAVEAERRRWEDADREAAEERQRRREYKERKRWAKKEARRAERRAEEEAEGHWDGRDAGRDEPVRVLAEDATTADEGEADETDAGEWSGTDALYTYLTRSGSSLTGRVASSTGAVGRLEIRQGDGRAVRTPRGQDQVVSRSDAARRRVRRDHRQAVDRVLPTRILAIMSAARLSSSDGALEGHHWNQTFHRLPAKSAFFAYDRSGEGGALS
eukprot:jgi/Mesvir1/22211/Mv06736-RA.1